MSYGQTAGSFMMLGRYQMTAPKIVSIKENRIIRPHTTDFDTKRVDLRISQVLGTDRDGTA